MGRDTSIRFELLPPDVRERMLAASPELRAALGAAELPTEGAPSVAVPPTLPDPGEGMGRLNGPSAPPLTLPSALPELPRIVAPSATAGETRERWLERAVETLRPTVTFAGAPRVSVGFPSTGGLSPKRRATTIGQCWDGAAAADGRAQVYVSPLLDDAAEVLAILVHELIHFKVGCKCGHRGPFRREMRLVGLEGKPTATVPGAQLAAVLARKAAELGPYPHAALTPQERRKQGTRMLKATCPACGCVVRLTRQWADAGLPLCGACAMQVETDDGAHAYVAERMTLDGPDDGPDDGANE